MSRNFHIGRKAVHGITNAGIMRQNTRRLRPLPPSAAFSQRSAAPRNPGELPKFNSFEFTYRSGCLLLVSIQAEWLLFLCNSITKALCSELTFVATFAYSRICLRYHSARKRHRTLRVAHVPRSQR